MRIVFHKGEPIKYISHLDLLRAWERVVRRADLPLAYSQGFHPHPRITIAMPLPVGCTGEREVLDLILEEPRSTEEVFESLKPVLPQGISVVDVEEVPLRSPALTTLFRQATYQTTLSGITADEVERRIAEFMRRDTVPVEFRRKKFDLRPLVGSLTLKPIPQEKGSFLSDQEHQAKLEAVLLRDSKGRIGRPDVLLEALGLSAYARHIHRLEIEFDQVPK